MRRQAVQDADIHQFRNKLEAFGRRQSEQLSDSANRRKRSADQSRPNEGMQRIQQWSADVYAQSTRPTMKRPRTMMDQRQAGIMTMDEMSDFSPPVNEVTQSTPYGSGTYDSDRARTPFARYAEAGYAPAQGIAYQEPQWMSATPASERDDMEMLSATMTRESSRTWSPPQTPVGPDFDSQGCPRNMDVSRLTEAERNLFMALGPQSDLLTPRPPKSSNQEFDAAFGQYVNMH